MSESDSRQTVSGWINPLRIFALEGTPFRDPADALDPSDVIADICRSHSPRLLDDVRVRYGQLTELDHIMFAVPSDKRILDKIIWPLRSAKGAYCLGDSLGCVAMCGMVCEMAIIFLYDLLAKSAVLSQMDAEHQRLFRKRSYESLGQEKRIANLRALGLANEAMLTNADIVRRIRREYLHFLTKTFKHLDADALDSYQATFQVVNALLALPATQNGLVVPAHLEDYLRRKRLISEGQ